MVQIKVKQGKNKTEPSQKENLFPLKRRRSLQKGSNLLEFTAPEIYQEVLQGFLFYYFWYKDDGKYNR